MSIKIALRVLVVGLALGFHTAAWAARTLATTPITVSAHAVATIISPGPPPTVSYPSAVVGSVSISLVNLSNVKQDVTVTVYDEQIQANIYPQGASLGPGYPVGSMGIYQLTHSFAAWPTAGRSQTVTLQPITSANISATVGFSETAVFTSGSPSFQNETQSQWSPNQLCSAGNIQPSQVYLFYTFRIYISVAQDQGAVLANLSAFGHIHCESQADGQYNYQVNGARPF